MSKKEVLTEFARPPIEGGNQPRVSSIKIKKDDREQYFSFEGEGPICKKRVEFRASGKLDVLHETHYTKDMGRLILAREKEFNRITGKPIVLIERRYDPNSNLFYPERCFFSLRTEYDQETGNPTFQEEKTWESKTKVMARLRTIKFDPETGNYLSLKEEERNSETGNLLRRVEEKFDSIRGVSIMYVEERYSQETGNIEYKRKEKSKPGEGRIARWIYYLREEVFDPKTGEPTFSVEENFNQEGRLISRKVIQ